MDQIKYVEKIKSQYGENGKSKVDEIVALDKKVHRAPEITAYTVGIIGSLILGIGMCLAMKVILDLMPLGIVIGCIGILIVSANYPIYKKSLAKRKKKYASKILALSNEILDGNN